MTTDLTRFIRAQAEDKFRLIEKERQRKESKWEPCFLVHGGGWDIGQERLVEIVVQSVSTAAQDCASAESLIQDVFNELVIYCSDSGGDHHTGYFQDYSVSTEGLRRLARELESRLQILPDKEPPGQLIETVRDLTEELLRQLRSHPHALHSLSPREFEELVAELLASFGWDVQITPKVKDGGYDIFGICRDISGEKSSWIIECKKYSLERKVGIDIARSLYAVKGELRVSSAMLATTSHFTGGVHAFKTSRYDFSLRDYESIIEWINAYRPNPNGKLYIKNSRLILPEDFHRDQEV